ncbi:MAG TPA: LysE family translocator [Gemmatimonadaceae bacterium]|nr:LysE family translocator [Gemmatimonadaceae bacterium]
MTVAQSLVSFALAAGVLTITPGLDTALVIRTSTVEGPRKAVLAMLGINGGLLVWGAAVAIGLAALLTASEIAFTVLKWVGAGYLVWLGVTLLLRPRQRFDPSLAMSDHHGANWFWRGLLNNLLNPKVGVFYVSFLPQFIPTGVPTAPYTFLLAVIHVVLGLIWLSALILATHPLNRALQRPSVIRALDRLTGIVFVGFGVKLAVSRR